mmetsp:Transcript_125586/g.250564  ORF Transcript_125586/g.250564 Transcript_125586/m.250564 type:complete len:309 (+) Transcript_125586:278-1204(+)
MLCCHHEIGGRARGPEGKMARAVSGCFIKFSPPGDRSPLFVLLPKRRESAEGSRRVWCDDCECIDIDVNEAVWSSLANGKKCSFSRGWAHRRATVFSMPGSQPEGAILLEIQWRKFFNSSSSSFSWTSLAFREVPSFVSLSTRCPRPTSPMAMPSNCSLNSCTVAPSLPASLTLLSKSLSSSSSPCVPAAVDACNVVMESVWGPPVWSSASTGISLGEAGPSSSRTSKASSSSPFKVDVLLSMGVMPRDFTRTGVCFPLLWPPRLREVEPPVFVASPKLSILPECQSNTFFVSSLSRTYSSFNARWST